MAMMKNDILLIKFNITEGKKKVLDCGLYHFDSKPLIMKSQVPKMDFSKGELQSVPICIKIPGLEFKYWGAKSLRKIRSLIGKPLMVDRNTEQKMGLSFSKISVEVQIGKALPDTIHFRNER